MNKLLLLFLGIFFFSCNKMSDTPSDETAKKCISNYFADNIQILSYKKIDGLSKEKDGVKYYENSFTAEIKFIGNMEDYHTGEEYKIIKGVNHYIKTENGWSCTNTDLENAEIIPINNSKKTVADTDQLPETTNVSENTTSFVKGRDSGFSPDAVAGILHRYYQVEMDKNYADYYNVFAEHVDFFDKKDQTVDEIIKESYAYNQKWGFSELNVDNSSIRTTASGADTQVTYDVFYKVKKNEYDNWKTFNLAMFVTLNSEGKITQIFEVKK